MIEFFLIIFSGQENTGENTHDANTTENEPLTEAEVTLGQFWPTITDEIKRIKTVDAKNQVI